MINITNENDTCSHIIKKSSGLSILFKIAILNTPRLYIEKKSKENHDHVEGMENLIDDIELDNESKFDVLLLTIGLLVNLIETDPTNRVGLANQGKNKVFFQLFFGCYFFFHLLQKIIPGKKVY